MFYNRNKKQLCYVLIIFGFTMITCAISVVLLVKDRPTVAGMVLSVGTVLSIVLGIIVTECIFRDPEKTNANKRESALAKKHRIVDKLANEHVDGSAVFEVNCPFCESRIRITKRQFSGTIRCPECGNELDLYKFLTM